MKKLFLITVLTMLMPIAAQASVTVNTSVGFLFKNDGSMRLSPNSTLTLIADKNGDGFGDLTSLSGSWTAGADDQLLARFSSNDGFGLGSSFDALVFNNGEDSLTGSPLLLAWYDLPYDVSDVGPGNDIFFGTYRNDNAEFGADFGWIVPADGSTGSLNFITESLASDFGASGGHLDELGIAQFKTLGTQVVPEPISAILAVIGGGTMFMRRKFVS